jgi:hypothetical protein
VWGTESTRDSVVAALHLLVCGGIGCVLIFWMFSDGAGVIGIFAESMGPTIIHFQAIPNVDMGWCRGGRFSGRRI